MLKLDRVSSAPFYLKICYLRPSNQVEIGNVYMFAICLQKKLELLIRIVK